MVRDGAVVAGKEIILCITGDHPLVDGVQSAMFFDCLTRYLADPDLLAPAD